MNTVPQKFNLKWYDYKSHITSVFNSLRSAGDFVDCTLRCEGKEVKVHKLLLAASSAYFKDIFLKHPCPCHVLTLEGGMTYDDVSAIVKFIYDGEINIKTEKMNSFLKTAQVLKITGFADDSKQETKVHNEMDLQSAPLPAIVPDPDSVPQHLEKMTDEVTCDNAQIVPKRANKCIKTVVTSGIRISDSWLGVNSLNDCDVNSNGYRSKFQRDRTVHKTTRKVDGTDATAVTDDSKKNNSQHSFSSADALNISLTRQSVRVLPTQSSVCVVPQPSVHILPKPLVRILPKPLVPILPNPPVPVLPKPPVPVLPKPSVLVLPKSSVPVLPQPSVPVLPQPSVPVLPQPSVPVLPQPSVPVLPQLSQSDASQQDIKVRKKRHFFHTD